MTTDPSPKKAVKKRAREEQPEESSPGRTVFFLVTIAALIVGGWYLVNGLAANSKLEDCTMSGRRNCVPPIDESKVK